MTWVSSGVCCWSLIYEHWRSLPSFAVSLLSLSLLLILLLVLLLLLRLAVLTYNIDNWSVCLWWGLMYQYYYAQFILLVQLLAHYCSTKTVFGFSIAFARWHHRSMDNSRTNQIAENQLADTYWISMVSASWPVRELVVRDLGCPRVDQVPHHHMDLIRATYTGTGDSPIALRRRQSIIERCKANWLTDLSYLLSYLWFTIRIDSAQFPH